MTEERTSRISRIKTHQQKMRYQTNGIPTKQQKKTKNMKRARKHLHQIWRFRKVFGLNLATLHHLDWLKLMISRSSSFATATIEVSPTYTPEVGHSPEK